MKRAKKKSKIIPISILKRTADAIFSLWIRNRDKACVLCGSRKELQNGHYISRSVNILRYDIRNCNCCCVVCNVFKNGNMVEYSAFMRRKHGPDIIETLLKEKQQLHQFTRQELESIITKYGTRDK